MRFSWAFPGGPAGVTWTRIALAGRRARPGLYQWIGAGAHGHGRRIGRRSGAREVVAVVLGGRRHLVEARVTDGASMVWIVV
jgi:hypothetical protein